MKNFGKVISTKDYSILDWYPITVEFQSTFATGSAAFYLTHDSVWLRLL